MLITKHLLDKLMKFPHTIVFLATITNPSMRKANSLLSSETFHIQLIFLKLSDRKLEYIMLQSKLEVTQLAITDKGKAFFLLMKV